MASCQRLRSLLRRCWFMDTFGFLTLVEVELRVLVDCLGVIEDSTYVNLCDLGLYVALPGGDAIG